MRLFSNPWPGTPFLRMVFSPSPGGRELEGGGNSPSPHPLPGRASPLPSRERVAAQSPVSKQPRAVVLDGEMPGCSALCSRLRQFTPIPLVVMGVAAEEEGWDGAVEAGADCYLPWATKPVEAVAFFQAMLRR